MKVSKCIFEVRDMNKQKLLEVAREKKGKKEFRVVFRQERRKGADSATYGGGSKEAEKEFMNAGILTLHCSGSSRLGKRPLTKTDCRAGTQCTRSSFREVCGEKQCD